MIQHDSKSRAGVHPRASLEGKDGVAERCSVTSLSVEQASHYRALAFVS